MKDPHSVKLCYWTKLVLSNGFPNRANSICFCPPKVHNEDFRQLAYLLTLIRIFGVEWTLAVCSEYALRSNSLKLPTGHTSNLWRKCPLYGCNATGRPIIGLFLALDHADLLDCRT